MFKTISAALLAVSLAAAPAFAGTAGKIDRAPVHKSVQAPVIKAEPSSSKFLNANARMGHHHRHKHFRHHSHRHHKHHIGAFKTHAPKLATKPVHSAARRG